MAEANKDREPETAGGGISWYRYFINYRILFYEFTEALCVGIITALAAILFKLMIEAVSQGMLFIFGELTGWRIPASIALGGLLVGVLSYFLARDLKGGSIPGVITSVFKNQGLIQGRLSFLRMVLSALTIGSGGSAGKEGPIVQIGASLGSKFAQLLKLSGRNRVLMLACGVAAGIASAFNAPLAGVFFALEIILGRFNCHAFSVVVISSAASCVLTRILTGDRDEFTLPVYIINNYSELLLFVGLGIAAGFVGVLFTRSIAWTEKRFAALALPSWIKPALGGLLCGLAAIFYPHIMGGGFNIVEQILNCQFSLALLGILVVLKILGTSLTLGSGGSGGDLAPALFTGAAMGGFYGELMQLVFPGSVCLSGGYALVGMSAVFAAASRAPITSVFLLFEITSAYHMFLPLLLASVSAVLTASAIDSESLYTLKLSREVVSMHDGEDGSAYLRAAKVKELMETDWHTIDTDCSVEDAIKTFGENGFAVLPIVDKEGRYYGQLDRKDIVYWRLRIEKEKLNPGQVCVREIMRDDIGYVSENDSLATAVYIMRRCRIGVLPVLEGGYSHKFIGMITRSRMFEQIINGMDVEEKG
ncbi:chloride channel protein [bacterium]|nr:chloride channel protein [bacterium]